MIKFSGILVLAANGFNQMLFLNHRPTCFMKISTSQKIFLTIVCFAVAIVGFMVKLPSVFRHYDKELHTLFYFLAAGFLNVLFADNKLIRHILIFAALSLMSVSIEYAQEYSNTLLRKRIHGRYDPEDIIANTKGLVAFSVLWLIYFAGRLVYRNAKKTE
jgi:hypothetical protein